MTRDAWSLSLPRLIVSLVLAVVIFQFVYRGPPVDRIAGVDLRFGLDGPLAGDPWKWAGVFLLVLVVLTVEKRGAISLLLEKPSKRDLKWVLYAFGGFMAWSWVLSLFTSQEGNEGVSTITQLGVGGVMALITTAAITEKVVYRGYLAERLGALFGPRRWARWVGAGMSLAIFVYPHVVFFDPSWLLHQFPGALAIAAIALLRRNLIAAMLLHFLINLPILIPTILA